MGGSQSRGTVLGFPPFLGKLLLRNILFCIMVARAGYGLPSGHNLRVFLPSAVYVGFGVKCGISIPGLRFRAWVTPTPHLGPRCCQMVLFVSVVVIEVKVP